jgi:hypothetical protein
MLPEAKQKGAPQTETVEDKLEGMAKLVATMQNFMPKPVDPNTQVQQMSEAFQKGQELAKSKDSNGENSMATMMTAMMQMQQQNMQFMMTMMQNNKPVEDEFSKMLKMKMISDMTEHKSDKKESFTTQIKEFREAGLIPKKDEGGLAETLKTMVMLKDLSGEIFGGEGGKTEGGVLDKLLSGIGEKLPDIIGNVTGAINNVVELNKAKLKQAEAMRTGARPVLTPAKGAIPANPMPNSDKATPMTTAADYADLAKTADGTIDDTALKTPEDKMNFLVMMFANQLNGWVLSENHSKEAFDKITAATIRSTDGKPIMQDAIKAGTMQPDDLAKMIVSELDKVNYSTPEKLAKLLKYCQAYASYIIGDDKYVVECDTCGQLYNFDDAKEFEELAADERYCDEEGCEGIIRHIETEATNTSEIHGEAQDSTTNDVTGEVQENVTGEQPEGTE